MTERDHAIMVLAEREVAEHLSRLAPPETVAKVLSGALRDAGDCSSGYATPRDYTLALEDFALARLGRCRKTAAA